MVWYFYVLTISTVSDASFRESPLQTGVKTDSFTGISSNLGAGKPTTRKSFPKGYKSERDL